MAWHCLCDVESVEYQHMLIVLGQRHDVAFRSYLQTTASAHLYRDRQAGKTNTHARMHTHTELFKGRHRICHLREGVCRTEWSPQLSPGAWFAAIYTKLTYSKINKPLTIFRRLSIIDGHFIQRWQVQWCSSEPNESRGSANAFNDHFPGRWLVWVWWLI